MSPQSTIAHYRIVSKLGQGGMGEVWRAADTKLGREVAIKVLPDAFAADADRMARFTREAQVLASLNHPNIAAIYGVEERALVMELVEGENLHGPLPLDTAVKYARQIADALEAAHERGIVHRDLKPANIRITPDGTVKVLDFGLAKSTDPASGDSNNSPTLTISATRAGVILGTAGYMSPEQAAGKAVDKRADIWSFGVVLWEMLTGSRLFEGETVSHTLADVLRAPIDLGKLPPETPAPLRSLIARCLERDVKKRLRDIGEARILLEAPIAPAVESAAAPPARSSVAWGVAAGLLAVTAGLAFVHFRETPPEARLIRTYIPPPDGTTFNFSSGLPSTGPVVLSPDGRRMAYSIKAADGKNQLWLRPLDALTAQPLAGTEDAIHPFWSPDSRFIAFFAAGKLKKIDTAGGPPVTLCDAPGGRGGTWNDAGVIVFFPNGTSGIRRVSASGGAATGLELDTTGRWPWFLPDGRHFLFSNGGAIRLGSLDSKQTKPLLDTISDAQYAQGYVLYLREDTLMAQPFDVNKLALSGDAVPVAENVRSVGSQRRGIFSVSRNGTLTFQSGTMAGSHRLTWLDRSGKKLGTVGDAADLMIVHLSPDGGRVASAVLDPANRTYDIWLYDVARGLRTRFTFENANGSLPLVWSPDGSSIAYETLRNGKSTILRKAANLSGGEEVLYSGEALLYPAAWSPDGGSLLLLKSSGGRSEGGIVVLPLTGERKATPFLPTAIMLTGARLSPDGRWMLYTSFESARSEVYVVPYPGGGGKLQISASGGVQPRWRSDGKEIFYVAGDGRLMAAEVKASGASLEVGRVQALFGGLPNGAGPPPYDVAPGGQRFLVDVLTDRPGPEPLAVVQNWTVALKK